MPMLKTAALLFLHPALLLGACGQSTVITPPVVIVPPVVAPLASTLSLRIFIPNAVKGQGVTSQFISGATSSLRVQLGNLDTTLA